MRRSTILEYPAMRLIDLRPYYHNGETYYMLRDPLQLSEDTMLVPPALVGALSFLDGAHTAADVAKDLERYFGYRVQADAVQGLVQALDEACLLRNERSEVVRWEKTQAFRQEPYRPALLAGPEDAAARGALRRQLDGFLAAAPPAEARPDFVSAMAAGRFGLLSPHIDYGRGGAVYAQVWQEAAEAIRSAEVVILLGTDHQGDDPFTLTRQSYATPYGVLPTAQPVVDAVVDVLGEDEAFAGELRHRGEHSLELVAVWLHHMRQGAPVELAPILVGSLYQHINGGSSPQDDRRIEQVLAAVAEATRGRRVAVVASGDMSHVGAAFGGDALDDDARLEVRRDDEELIATMRQGSAAEFFEAIRRVRDRNNVCGVSPIYLTLRLLDKLSGPAHESGRQNGREHGRSTGNAGVRGELHGYASCSADEVNGSAVTVAGMIFH